MRVLFVHNNFPAQFIHLAPALVARGHDVRAIGGTSARELNAIQLVKYKLGRGTGKDVFPLAVRYEADCMRGAGAAQGALKLAGDGFVPDVIYGHLGWGETMFLGDIWPTARQILYAEFHVAPKGLDVGFDPEFPDDDFERAMRVRAKNGAISLVMAQCTRATAPTAFQRSSFPEIFQPLITLAHDGIDTNEVKPDGAAQLVLSQSGKTFRPGDPVVTYINRHLEPLRGVHQMLRAAPRLLAGCKDAHLVIVGSGDGSGYGHPPPPGTSWKDVYLSELRGQIDLERVHFIGHVDRATFLRVLQVSAAHVYLTYPFVLSWSLLEAMSAGCAIVASDTAPVREVITDGRNGVLVDFFRPAALADACLDMLERPRHYEAMRAAARADVVASFDLRTICLPRMIELVESFAT